MRQITKDIVEAFLKGKRLSISNTMTDGKYIYLFGNKIVKRGKNRSLLINNCGYITPTTKERLNGLLEYVSKDKIHQFNSEWYWQGNIFPYNQWVYVVHYYYLNDAFVAKLI